MAVWASSLHGRLELTGYPLYLHSIKHTNARLIVIRDAMLNAETMSLFLQEVAQRHASEFVLMVMDQAGWHLAGDLCVPSNMRLLFLPPYSPELNPAEHLWKSLREDCFANHVFASLDAVETVLATGLAALEEGIVRTQRMTGFGWITSISMNAN